MSKVVVISGHPNLESSNCNTQILASLEKNISDIEVRRLDQIAPNYQFDVAAEQQALLSADVVVLQFPFYWYSVPALLKKWIDDVFAYDFAYGSKGDKLQGKQLFLSFTIGGPEESYQPLGYNHFSIDELIKPLQQTAYLAGMTFHKPVYTHRMVYIPGVYNTLEEVESRANEHSERLIAAINEVTQSPQAKVSEFAKQWFAMMDALPESTDAFEALLADDFSMLMPEGEFSGVSGFRDWYQLARASFKPGAQHTLEQIGDVTEQDGCYQVQLRVRAVGETPQGDAINLLVNEDWQFSLAADGHVKLNRYQVEVLN
ncbi:NAD(P)H-dependent oxidoreductase [Paraferrimonas haliotis]|uniref:NAD(P)H-dependent oxidoreductase n=1 Tax=Paraferrimonas haliotis TaxID=2013866 RepID=UPI000BA99A52|nr:NAD(P)H-dependent oxidoreductase [Paraferrimonas haliotis]